MTEATAFLARTSGLDTLHQNDYIAMIDGLVAAGIWSKLDVLYILASQDSTTALLNLISSTYNGIAHGSPSFTADRGFTGVDGSGAVYIATGFIPSSATSPKFVQNSAHVSVWNLTNTQTQRFPIGTASGGTSKTSIHTQFTDGNTYFYINGPNSTTGVATAPDTAAGHYIANRSGASAWQGYKNGVSITTGTNASQSVSATEVLCLAYNGPAGIPDLGEAHQIASISVGSSLTTTESNKLYEFVRDFLVTVGAWTAGTVLSSGIASDETFFSPTVAIDQTCVPPLFVDTNSFFAPTVSASYTLTVALVTDTDTFFAPTVTAGSVTLTASLVTDTETFFSPTIVITDQTLVPPNFTDTDTFFAPTVTTGTITLTPSLTTDTDTFFAPAVNADAVTLTPSLVTDTDTLFAPTAASSVTLTAGLVSDTDTFYAPTLSTGVVTLLPSLITDADVITTAVVGNIISVDAPFVTDTDNIPHPIATYSSTLLPTLFTFSDVFFAPTLSGTAVALHPIKYTDTDIFYTPTVQLQVTQGTGGGGNGTIPANVKYAVPVTMSQSGLIVTLEISINQAKAANTRMALYADSAGVPGALLAQSAVKTSVINGINVYPLQVGYAVLAGQVVWVTFHTDTKLNALGNSTSSSRYNTDTFADGISNPFGASSIDNQKAAVVLIVLGAVNATVSPGLVSDSETVYVPTVTYSNSITAPYSTSEFQDFFYAPSVVNSASLLPSTYSDVESFYMPIITVGSVSLHPPFMTDDDATVIPVIGVGDVNVKFPALFVDRDIFGDDEIASTVTALGANLHPTKITDTDVFYPPEDVSVYHIVDGVILSAGESIFAPTVSSGSVTLTPQLVRDVDQYWFSQLAQGVGASEILPQMVQNGDTFYAPVLTGGTRLLLPGLLVDTDQFYQTRGPSAQGRAHHVRLRGSTNSLTVAATSTVADIELIGDASEAQVELEGNDA